MVLSKKIEIEEGKVTASIYCSSLGDNVYTAQDEAEILKNYPLVLQLKDVDFKGYVKVEDNKPVIVESETGGAELIDFNKQVINKTIAVNENFSTDFTIDSEKLSPTGEVINTKKLMAEAMAVIYIDKVSESVGKIVADAKSTYNDVEGETEETV